MLLRLSWRRTIGGPAASGPVQLCDWCWNVQPPNSFANIEAMERHIKVLHKTYRPHPASHHRNQKSVRRSRCAGLRCRSPRNVRHRSQWQSSWCYGDCWEEDATENRRFVAGRIVNYSKGLRGPRLFGPSGRKDPHEGVVRLPVGPL